MSESRIHEMASLALRGGSHLPLDWICAHWNERLATEGSPLVTNPVTKAVTGGRLVPRARMFRGLTHFPSVATSNFRVFSEIAQGDMIVDLAGSADVPEVDGIEWMLALRVRCVAPNWTEFHGLTTVDGVALQEGDRVLVLNEDEDYAGVFVASAGDWERDPDVGSQVEMPVWAAEGGLRGGYRCYWNGGWTPVATVSGVVYVAKPTGNKLAEAWDARAGGMPITRTLLLRRAT